MKKSTGPIWIGIALTVAWLAVLRLLLRSRTLADIEELVPNALGDFLAGVVAPLAFLWLVISIFQQQQELRQNTAALRLQAEHLDAQVREMNLLVGETARQTKIALDTFNHSLEQQQRDHDELMRITAPNLIVRTTGATNTSASFVLTNTGGDALDIRIDRPLSPAGKDMLRAGENMNIAVANRGDFSEPVVLEVRCCDRAEQYHRFSMTWDPSTHRISDRVTDKNTVP